MPSLSRLRLMLDEHYPDALARRLTERGLDVQAVISRPDLRGKNDTTVLLAAKQEGRVVVTEDVSTFPVAIDAVPDHMGVVFCDHQRFPRTANTVSRIEEALFAFASNPPAICEYPGFIWWLA